MHALCFQSVGKVSVRQVPDPEIEVASDVIVQVEMAGLCGSDLHPFFGREVGLDPGTVMGHEFVGTVIDVGDDVTDFAVGDRVASWFSLLGSVNLFVAILNLVPLVPLDGGHIAGALWDAMRRGWAKLRRQPDPGPFDTARLLPVAYGVGAFLLIGGAVLILADLINPISLF